MSYIPVGAIERKSDRELIEEIVSFQKRQARKHRIELMIAGAGALFAAIRLGIIFAPKVKRRHQLGKLGQ